MGGKFVELMRRRNSSILLNCGWAVVIIGLSGCGSSGPEPTAQPGAQASSPVENAVSTTVERTEADNTLMELCQQFFPSRDVHGVMMIFVLPDCPIANAYAAEYSRLHAEFAPRGLPLIVVHVDPDLTETTMQAHARDYRITAPVLLDRDQSWVRRAGATKTPEAVIFRPDGTVLYRGRIDDRFADVGKPRSVSTVQDLRSALQSVLSGDTVSKPWPAAVGCPIPELPPKD